MEYKLIDNTIIKKTFLNQYEIDSAFEIIKLNMIDLGFEVSQQDKEFWCQNIKDNLEKSNFYFYLVYLDGEIVGFMEIVNEKEDFIISEIQLSNKAKRSKIILSIIKYLLDSNELANINKVYFSVLKNNIMSNKTFSHLGGKIIYETDKKFKYVIEKEDVLKYISQFKV